MRWPAQVIIHTDCGCAPNPGPGGWAASSTFKHREKELKGGEPESPNNRVGLRAAFAAVEAPKGPFTVALYTDSQYLRNAITSWIKDWKKNGWGTAAKKPVLNVDLWQGFE